MDSFVPDREMSRVHRTVGTRKTSRLCQFAEDGGVAKRTEVIATLCSDFVSFDVAGSRRFSRSRPAPFGAMRDETTCTSPLSPDRGRPGR